jgi:esterase/lipase
MKTFFRIILIVIATFGLVYLIGPKVQEPIYNAELPKPIAINSVSAYVHQLEKHHQLKPENEAEIIWADSTHQQTEYVVVYLHGFSASKEEGNPVHRDFAKSIHANLYLSRLADHGIDTIAPMQYFTADRLWESAKQALVIGKTLGKKVILVGTSTGGTLALKLAAVYPEIHSLVLMSPNIAINDDKVWILTHPWGLQIARLVTGGKERLVEGKSALYKKYWYTNYRLESVVQLQELLESSMNKSVFKEVKQPTLLLYYYKNEKEQDPVVSVPAMLKMFEELGSSQKEKQALPNTGNHVIGSSITSKDIPAVEKAIAKFASKYISQ